MTYPKVSIITPSFNQGEFIERTILSVLTQTYRNIEYIIIDGGSTDDTMRIIEKYRDRIDIVVHEKDKGQSDAINKGFRLATGDLVGWINSDDIIYRDCVEKIVGVANTYPDGVIYYTAIVDLISERDTFIQRQVRRIADRNYLLKKTSRNLKMKQSSKVIKFQELSGLVWGVF